MNKWYRRLSLFIPSYFVIYFLWMFFINQSLPNRFISGQIFHCIGLVIAYVSLYHSYKYIKSKERYYWLFLWMGTFFFIISQLFSSYYESVLMITPPSLGFADLFRLLQGLFFLLALLQIKYTKKNYYINFQLILDILITMTAAFSLFWYAFLSHTFYSQDRNWLYSLMAISYIVLDLGLLFGFLSIYLNRRKDFYRVAGKTSVIGFTLYITADILYFCFSVLEIYDHARWINSFWMFGLLLLGLSGLKIVAEGNKYKAKKLQSKKSYTTKVSKMLLPYTSFTALLIAMLINTRIVNSLVFGLAVTGIMIMIRQFSVIVQNNALIKSLQKANQELRYFLKHNKLTNLYNREYFEEQIYKFEQSDYYPISILKCDINGLRYINQDLGHESGDRLLVSCANLLKDTLSGNSNHYILARVAGDEFAALLPKTDLEKGHQLIDLLKQSIQSYNKKNKVLPLSLSFGMATAENKRTPLMHILKEADNNMCHEKLIQKNSCRSQLMDSLMAALAERDYLTEGHAQRLAKHCAAIGRRLNLPLSTITNLNLLAQAHDLGKVGIPDAILFKAGPLTEEEWVIMKQHCEKGYRIALASSDLEHIADLILKHHERWDGTGYPLGLKGNEIPIECRILSVVDAYDAMTNNRLHSRAIGKLEAMDQLEKNSGTQFDPRVVRIFIDILTEKDSVTGVQISG